jgi:8-oxo-dGTP pyrophosphatase MutT (NUDIX family)
MAANETILISKVFILNDKNQILVLRRSKSDPKWAMDWDLPGGAIEFAEDPMVAAAREAREEANIDIDPQTLQLIDVSSLSDGQPAITITYWTSKYGGSVKLSFEHDTHKWIGLGEIHDLQIPNKYKLAADKLSVKLIQ